MKLVNPFFVMTVVTLAVVSAPAQSVLYSNGPINGQNTAWCLNGSCGPGIPSDSFTLTGNASITGIEFGEWLIPGDVNTSILATITSLPDGGTTFFSADISLTQSNCSPNNFGFDVCTSTGVVNVSLPAGNYWLNLADAVVTGGGPAYWDENSGVGCMSPGCPSLAEDSGIGTIPSESFTILGNSGTVPEPTSITLLGTGLLAVVGTALRRYRRS